MASSSHVPPPPPTTQRPPWAEEPPGPPEGPVDEEKQDKIECEEKGNGTSEERDKPEVKDKVSPEAPRMGTLRERLEFVRSAEAGIPCGFRRQAVLLVSGRKRRSGGKKHKRRRQKRAKPEDRESLHP